MYDTILVPTDGSDPARAAAEHAVELAAETGAAVRAVYVADAAAEAVAATTAAVPDIEDELAAAGEDAVGEVAALAADAGVDCETAVLEGVPYETVLAHAADRGVDCIVMGTHGRTGLARAALGSTAERVVRRADVPVLTL